MDFRESLLGLSTGPALLGAVHDMTGTYAAAVGLCIGLELLAAMLILVRPRRARQRAANHRHPAGNAAAGRR